MSLLGWLNNKQVVTVTLDDIEARLRAEPYRPQIQAPANAVFPQEAAKTEIARQSGMVVAGLQIYNEDGFVPAEEWAQLSQGAEKYLATLEPMRRDPLTGRPVRY